MTTEAVTHALELTRALLDAARQRDWQRAGELAAERSPLLMTLKADQPPRAIAMIREIQALDEQISAQARTGLDVLQQENVQAQQRIHSVSQYQAIGML